MKRSFPVAAAVILAAATLACSFTFDLPTGNDRPEPGPLMSRDFSIPIPEQEPADLQLAFAAGELRVSPGAETNLVEGTASWNIEQLEPTVELNENQVVLSSGNVENMTDLDFNFDLNFDEGTTNRWELSLAPVPMDLTLSAGAYEGDLELGGLAIRQLEVSSGASDVELSFSELNQIEMEEFRYNTGASSARLLGLNNARFGSLRFQGGAGDFTLDFGDELHRDSEVTVDAALSSVTIVIPEGINATMTLEGALAEVSTPQGFSRSGDQYVQEGEGPMLTVRVQIGAGEIEILRP